MIAFRLKCMRLALFVAVTLVTIPIVTAGQETVPLKELRLASIVALGPGINPEDGRLALEVIMQKTLVRKSDPYRVNLTLLSGLESVGSMIDRDRFHFLALTGLDYAELRQTIPLAPLLILSKQAPVCSDKFWHFWDLPDDDGRKKL